MSRRKQIILISLDALRADHLSSSGYSRDTSPHLSRLIKDSSYHRDASCNGCWTIPSHMSLLTGTLPSRHAITTYWENLPRKQFSKLGGSIKTMAEILKAHGMSTIKYAWLPDELDFGKGFDINRRYDPFYAGHLLKNVFQDLENHKEKDFFLFIHTWMVHAPYSNCYFLKKGRISAEKRNYINNFRKLFPSNHQLVTAFQGFLEQNNLFNREDCMALYDGGIRYVDQYIGKLVNKTRQLRMYRELMIIVVSDHGEHFGEHVEDEFYSYHGKDFFEEFIKVPLIIKYPFQLNAGKVSHPVSLVDVFPTILDFYEFDIPAFVQGESLLKPRSERQGYIVSEAISEDHIEKKMIRVGDLKYIITMKEPSTLQRVNWGAIVERRLFNIKNDPLEKENLYHDLKFRNLCLGFEKKLIRIIKNSAQTSQQREKITISKETIEKLKALGYL